ncbi:MAG: zinc transporter ZupT [Bacteroidota bacterium]|nr:zinc transporter ZupT [Bacteroidota bacterium]
MEDSPILFAFALTLFAGLSTGIGSALAFFAKRTNTKFLSLSMGFSAGVMIYVSMVEIFVKAKDSLVEALGAVDGNWATVGGFFGGIALIAIIDRLVPSAENPHEMRMIEDIPVAGAEPDYRRLYRTGMFSAIAIAIHNFPEGLATFLSAIQDPMLGIPIAVAVAIHNIPEGIAVSIPVYYATNNRKRAFLLSFGSGLAEPLGAVIGYFILQHFFSDILFGVVFASVAGIMVFISLDELLPGAQEYGEHHLAIYGLIAGMAVMAVSLLLFI